LAVIQSFTIRTATADDAAFLTSMLIETVNWQPARNWSLERIMADPATAHYVQGWPRPGDSGVIAIDPQDQPIGAAWLRVFSADDPGYGFVSADVPELSIAVTTGWRHQGVGRALLRGIHQQAQRAGVTAISLSVERTNPAWTLYAAEGYRTIDSGRDSDTMVIEVRRTG
jgi:GNAT superfamily N-acetyltransferase